MPQKQFVGFDGLQRSRRYPQEVPFKCLLSGNIKNKTFYQFNSLISRALAVAGYLAYPGQTNTRIISEG